MARLEPGERAGDQEAGRTEDVGPPDMMLCLRRADRRPDSDKGTDVELDGSHRLHGGGKPVDPAGQEHEDLATGGTRSPGCGIDRLAVLQEAGRGEEQRPDEERHRVGPRAHGVRVRGHRAQCEQERADGEQHPHPPVAIARRPPRRADWRGSVQVLAVRARLPARDHAVRALVNDEGDERPEPPFRCRFWLRRHQGPPPPRGAHSYPECAGSCRAASPGADEVVASGLRRRRLETRRAFSGEASRNGRNVANL